MSLSLKQDLSSQSFTNKNMSDLQEPIPIGHLENFYDDDVDHDYHDSYLENITKSSIKKGLDDTNSSAPSLEKQQILLKDMNLENVYCPICTSVCSVSILETGDLSMECNCTKIFNISANEFINDYLHNDKDKNNNLNGSKKNLSDLCCCKKHPKEKFIVYCTDCEEDRCIKCKENVEALYTNTEKKNKLCENHTLKRLDQNEELLKDIKDLLDKIKYPEKNTSCEGCQKFESRKDFENQNDSETDKKKIMNNLISIINCFIENYNKYQCYNSLLSIENFKQFLEEVNKSENKIYKFKPRKETIHLIKIRTEKELNEKISLSKMTYSIKITKTYQNVNLSILNNLVFSNLEMLILRGNLIKDISFLVKNEFPALKKIVLDENQIGNDAIEILSKANLPKLEHLNLYKNKITSIKIFDVIKNFKELKLFYIGENKFDMEEINRDNSYFLFPASLEEFGITGNFNGNADFVKRLNIENLKIFYISRNQLSDLKCLENKKFNELLEFWAISNNITNIKEITKIQGIEKIRKINLKQNKISNFQDLFDIVPSFPSLTELELVDNGISQKEADDMVKEIKDKYTRVLKIKVKED